MKELVIAANMIALARNRKGGSKRSAMLRMIMPFLSHETGDKLAEAIDKKDSKRFALEWDKVKKEITARLAIHHKKHTATASGACENPCPSPSAKISIDSGQTGNVYLITNPQIVEMIKLVCERLLLDADPCPIPSNRCVKHEWIDCRECVETPKPFDPNADMLELYDKLVTCRSF